MNGLHLDGRRWLVALLTSACATAGARSANAVHAARRHLTAADYYPLAVGWKWAYDLEKDGQKILAVYSVLDRIGDTVIVQAGEERLTYAVTPDGVAQREGSVIGDYVIKNPLVSGAIWQVGGGSAKVVSTTQELTTAAGHFTDCVVVEVTRTEPTRIARTTFAPQWVRARSSCRSRKTAAGSSPPRAPASAASRSPAKFFH